MMRKKFEAGFKARVALEAVKGEKTLAQLSSEYGVNATRISKWKLELVKGAAGLFGKKGGFQNNGQEEKVENLYKSIGELNPDFSIAIRNHEVISMTKVPGILWIPRGKIWVK